MAKKMSKAEAAKRAKAMDRIEADFLKNNANWDCPVCGHPTEIVNLAGDYDDTQHYHDRCCPKCGTELNLIYTYQYSSVSFEGDMDSSESPPIMDESWADQGPLSALAFLCKGLNMLGFQFQFDSLGKPMQDMLMAAARVVPKEDIPLVLASGRYSPMASELLTIVLGE